MKHNAHLDVKGVVVGSSASISSMNAIQAISVAGSSISRGTVVLSNDNNVSFGLNGVNLTVSLRSLTQTLTISAFPAVMGGNTPMTSNNSVAQASFATDAGGSTTTTGRIYMAPFPMYAHLHYNRVAMPVVLSFAGGTNSFTMGLHYGIYYQTGDTLSMVTSFGFNMLASKNSATQTFRWWHGNGQDSTTNSTSLSSAGNLSTRFHGLGHSPTAYVNTDVAVETLTAGQYFMAVIQTRYSTGTGLSIFPGDLVNGAAGSAMKQLLNSFKQTSTLDRLGRYWGSFSTTLASNSWGYNLLPATIETSRIVSTGFTTQFHFSPFLFMYRTGA